MTCKDCVHHNLCDANECLRVVTDIIDDYIDTIYLDNSQNRCSHFKNKADFVEVKHGRWLVDDFKRQNKKFLTCSECRAVIDCNVTYVDENEYDFCPYCGADMRKEGADND